MLEIQFLGKVRFIYDGNDISEKIGSKSAALVALLIQSRNGMRRERVMAYLWPDSNEDAAKYNLRYNFWQLKKMIGQDAAGNSFLRIDKDYCSIDSRYRFQCDILDVLNFNPSQETDVELLEKFRSIYGGEFFEGSYFNGCADFNELILSQRNNLENGRVKLLKRLAQLYEEASDYAACLEVLTEILTLEPYDEPTALKAMAVYTACGNRGAAIRYYKSFRSKLICNLGIQPSEELEQKYNEIKELRSAHQEKSIELETWCMKGVDYFWIAEVVEELIRAKLIEGKKVFPSEEIADLAQVVPRIASYCGVNVKWEIQVPISHVRIVRSFLHLLEEICSRQSLKVRVRKFENMDSCSGALFQHLMDKGIQGLELHVD